MDYNSALLAPNMTATTVLVPRFDLEEKRVLPRDPKATLP